MTFFLRRTAEQLPDTGTSLAGLRLRPNPAPTDNLSDWIFWNMNRQAATFLFCNLSSRGRTFYIDAEGRERENNDAYGLGFCGETIGFYAAALPTVKSLQLIRNEKNILEKLIINNE